MDYPFLIDVTGSPRDRGTAQGRAFAGAIERHLNALLGTLQASAIDHPESYLRNMVQDTAFEDAIEREMPHLLAEVEGIAKGASIDPQLVYAMQLMDEEWAYRRHSYGTTLPEKCSSFAVRAPGQAGTWIGQNMDLGSYTDGFQAVVRHAGRQGRPGLLLFTTVGMIALLGVNDAGVGVRVNSLPQLPNSKSGIPVAFMIRRLLETHSAEEAAELCRALPHATNQHYLIADPKRIISLECSAAGVKEYRPPDPTRVLHTNHPLVDFNVDKAAERNSVARLASLRSRLSTGSPSIEAMMQALSAFDDPDHPVCRLHNSENSIIGFTTGSMISLLTDHPGSAESYVSFGPPSERGYHRFGFEKAVA